LKYHKYVCALAALHLRQTRRLQDLGTIMFLLLSVKCYLKLDEPVKNRTDG